MIRAPIIPDGDIVFAPLESYLHIMILGDQIEKIVQNDITFDFGHVVDMTQVMTHRKDRLPTSNRIRADNLKPCQKPIRELVLGIWVRHTG